MNSTARPVPAVPTQPMTREDYLAWAVRQPGRHERIDGRVVRMNAETVGHVRMKLAVAIALREAVAATCVRCEALTGGVTIAIGDRDYEPDATVNEGDPIKSAALVAPNPVIVVEVLSPGSETVDTGRKLADYLRLGSIQHYLTVDPAQPLVTWHRRTGELACESRIVRAGPIGMDPPGIVIAVERLYALAAG